jgi:hypothetical protein
VYWKDGGQTDRQTDRRTDGQTDTKKKSCFCYRMEPQDRRWGEIIVINFYTIVMSGLALAPKTIGGEFSCQKLFR